MRVWPGLKSLDVVLNVDFMDKPKTTMSQVKSGVRLAGLSLLFILVAYLFFGGTALLFFPAAVDRNSFLGQHALIAAPIFLVVSITIMIATMNRWVKVLAGLLAFGVLNGLISISTGHLLANSDQSMSRLDAVYLTVFFAATAVLASTLRERKLSVVDRIAILAFVFTFAMLMGYEGAFRRQGASLTRIEFALMGIGFSCLLIAWGYDRFLRRSDHDLPDRDSHAGPAADPTK